MKKLLIGFVLLFSQLNLMAQRQENYIQYVNPLIGTQKMGHTFPGATVPFGAVQLSPDTDQQPHNIGGKYNKDAYKYCAGYQYDDREIVGDQVVAGVARRHLDDVADAADVLDGFLQQQFHLGHD